MSGRQNLLDIVIEAIISVVIAIVFVWALAPLFLQFGIVYFVLFILFIVGVIIAIVIGVYSRFRY